MKNQYFGDVNDYRKYGLLRTLADEGKVKIGICWMLTDADATRHGGKTEYLKQSYKWRRYDPDLFDRLENCINRGARKVIEAERLGLISGAIYFKGQLKTTQGERLHYFVKMFEEFTKIDLIFFDPDNGIEVPSVKLGYKKSSKYLFWREVCGAFAADHSVLIYQHFRREKRAAFIARMADEIQEHTGAKEVHALRTAHVVFFLAPQARHQGILRKLIGKVEQTWSGEIQVFVRTA